MAQIEHRYFHPLQCLHARAGAQIGKVVYTNWPSSKYVPRPCLLKMPDVLQIALLKMFRCAVGVHFVSNYTFYQI